MKVGDLVEYSPWPNQEIGVVTRVELNITEQWIKPHKIYQVTPMESIKAHGWDDAIKNSSRWYDHEDVEDGTIEIFEEVEDEGFD